MSPFWLATTTPELGFILPSLVGPRHGEYNCFPEDLPKHKRCPSFDNTRVVEVDPIIPRIQHGEASKEQSMKLAERPAPRQPVAESGISSYEMAFGHPRDFLKNRFV
jgi:hypothetical protein